MNYIAKTFTIAFSLLITLLFSQGTDNKRLVANIDEFLSEQFKSDEPGIAVIVSKNGQVVYKNAFGMANMELNSPMHTDNVFWLASISKQFTAVAILQLIEKGKLRLDDEITKFIPDYPVQGQRITIEHLLTHTSGIHNYSGMPDPEKKLAFDCTPVEIIDFFKNLPMRFTPGTQWEYSNSGYVLLGYIIEQITGKSYADYVEENFFIPLGMTNSYYVSDKLIIKNRVGTYSYTEHGFENSSPGNVTHVYAAGGIQSTVVDMFKWHQALQTYQLVKKETLDKAHSRYRLTDGTEVDYGYGWKMGFVYDSPTIWHGGLITGYGTMEMYLPEEDVFVAVLSNCDCIYPKDIALRLAALASGKPYKYSPAPAEHATLKDYTGVYEDAKGLQLVIDVLENDLSVQYGRGPKARILPYHKDRFFVNTDHTQTLEFSRNTAGNIEQVTSLKLTGNQVWTKTHKAIPDENGITVSESILESYAGEYEITHDISFNVTNEQGRLYIQAGDDEKLEMFADTQSKFFLKVNDAQLEFIKDSAGAVTHMILNQGGRQAEAKKIIR